MENIGSTEKSAENSTARIEDLLAEVARRLEHLETLVATYEPLLSEAARRMAGPMRWRRSGATNQDAQTG